MVITGAIFVAPRIDPDVRMEAAIVELEPLTEEAALEYIRRQEPDEDLHSVDWVIETADIAEAPFYLQITRQLHQARLLERSLPKRSDRQLDTRSVDRAELRFRLLRTWENALVEGHFAPGVPLSRLDREATVGSSESRFGIERLPRQMSQRRDTMRSDKLMDACMQQRGWTAKRNDWWPF